MGKRLRRAADPVPARGGPAAAVARPVTFDDLSKLGGLKKALAEASARRELQIREANERERALEREAEVFRRAVADVAPLAPTGRLAPTPSAIQPIARQHQLDERKALAQSLSDEIDIERLLETDDKLSFCRQGVGPESLRKLRRGHWVTQAQLDLHGLRTDDAREAVATFLFQCVRDGLRCVRVIHGKGLGSLNRQPVLKEKVMRWLTQRQEVIAFCQAPPFAGGGGALLVLLKSTVA